MWNVLPNELRKVEDLVSSGDLSTLGAAPRANVLCVNLFIFFFFKKTSFSFSVLLLCICSFGLNFASVAFLFVLHFSLLIFFLRLVTSPLGSVINNQNGQNSAREIQREFTRDFILIGRLPACD